MVVFRRNTRHCSRTYFPEAASGGPIGLIRDGDDITIDLTNRTLNVDQPEEELYRRREQLEPFKARLKLVILHVIHH